MVDFNKVACPFTYRNGRKCCGYIIGARLYGRGKDYPNVRKVRLWCSEKDDHAGAVSSFVSKERMEFYPDMLPAGVWKAIETGAIPST